MPPEQGHHGDHGYIHGRKDSTPRSTYMRTRSLSAADADTATNPNPLPWRDAPAGAGWFIPQTIAKAKIKAKSCLFMIVLLSISGGGYKKAQ